MDMNVIKKKLTEELLQDVEELLANIFSLRFKNAIGKLENPHMIKKLRKDIARIKTEINLRIKNGEVIVPLTQRKVDKSIKEQLLKKAINDKIGDNKKILPQTKIKEEKPHDNN